MNKAAIYPVFGLVAVLSSTPERDFLYQWQKPLLEADVFRELFRAGTINLLHTAVNDKSTARLRLKL